MFVRHMVNQCFCTPWGFYFHSWELFGTNSYRPYEFYVRLLLHDIFSPFNLWCCSLEPEFLEGSRYLSNYYTIIAIIISPERDRSLRACRRPEKTRYFRNVTNDTYSKWRPRWWWVQQRTLFSHQSTHCSVCLPYYLTPDTVTVTE